MTKIIGDEAWFHHREILEVFNFADIGEVIGCGVNSFVVIPNEKFIGKTTIENPVIIITNQKDKKEILQTIFAGTSAKVEKISGLCRSEKDLLDYLEEMGYKSFYSSKLVKENISPELEVIKALIDISNSMWDNEYSVKNIQSLIDEVEYKLDKNNMIENEFSISVIESLKKLKGSNLKDMFVLDVHEDQFIRLESKLICIDPIFTKAA